MELLGSLTAAQWTATTGLPNWRVKDIALHVLDDDLGCLARDRDGDSSGRIDAGSVGELVQALNTKNQRWVEAAAGLSRRLVTDMLAWSGSEIDSWLRNADLHRPATVGWASHGPVPFWFDLAREFTERWVHHQQILDALGMRDQRHERDVDVVLQTFVWAYPHQYRVDAPVGSTIGLRLGTHRWTLIRRQQSWELEPDGQSADLALELSADQAWRLLTGGLHDTDSLQRRGPDELIEPLLHVRELSCR